MIFYNYLHSINTPFLKHYTQTNRREFEKNPFVSKLRRYYNKNKMFDTHT